jgi:hypothetical protein
LTGTRDRATRYPRLAALGLAFLLAGCSFLPYYLQRFRGAIVATRESEFVDVTLGAYIARVVPGAQVGHANCTRARSFSIYFKVCALTVDGRTIPVGLRYVEGTERTIAVLLGAKVNLQWTERDLVERTRIQYHVHAEAWCPGPHVQILPVGAQVNCVVKTGGGKEHAARFWIAAKLLPHEVISTIAGLPQDAELAMRERRARLALGGDVRSAPGQAVAALIQTQVPGWQTQQPRVRLGLVRCPPRIDIRDAGIESAENGVSVCSLETNYGAMRIAAFSPNGKLVDFQNLSRPFDMIGAEHELEMSEEQYLRKRGVAATARVRCGSQQVLILSLLSTHYCRLTLSDGRSGRIAIEYYDPFQGPEFRLELPLAG